MVKHLAPVRMFGADKSIVHNREVTKDLSVDVEKVDSESKTKEENVVDPETVPDDGVKISKGSKTPPKTTVVPND